MKKYQSKWTITQNRANNWNFSDYSQILYLENFGIQIQNGVSRILNLVEYKFVICVKTYERFFEEILIRLTYSPWTKASCRL